jgi:hypothetical protein
MKARSSDRTVLGMTNFMNTSSCSPSGTAVITGMCRMSSPLANGAQPPNMA